MGWLAHRRARKAWARRVEQHQNHVDVILDTSELPADGGVAPPEYPAPEVVWDEYNTTVPVVGRFRRCGKCGFVAVILADQPYQMLDWIIDDHYYRYHARPSAGERAR